MRKCYFIATFLLTSVSLSAFAQATDWRLKIDPVVLKKMKAGEKVGFVAILKDQANTTTSNNLTKEQKGLYVFKTLTEKAKNTQGPVLEVLNNLRAVYRPFWIINAISIEGDSLLLNKIAQLEAVEQVIENANYVLPETTQTATSADEKEQSRGLEWGIKKTGADAAWALGYKGKGVVIGGQDSGYEWTHPAITKQYRGNGTTVDHNYNWHDCVTTGGGSKCGASSKEPCDDHSHGTHTMGTMVGYDGGANQIGMAPEAQWMGCRNMDQGAGKYDLYMDAFQWFLAPTDLSNKNPDPKKAPHVTNNSWGCPSSEGCNSSNFASMEKAVINLTNAGIVMVFSAGNDGAGCSTITTPGAIFTSSFTVGSTTSSDAISSFSSRGPVTAFGPSKMSPDISAPGSSIRSSVPGKGYGSKDGTSMAGPHVAGLVALIISANSALAGNVTKIEEIIQQSAVKLKSSQTCGGVAGSSVPNNTFGHGRIDALAAVKLAVSLVSVNELQNQPNGIKTYPNPFTETITFELSNLTANSTLNVYNLTGELITTKSWQNTPTTFQLNLSTISSGAYFYKIESASGRFQGKIFKVK